MHAPWSEVFVRAGCLLRFYYSFLQESSPRLTEEQPTDVYVLAGGGKQSEVLHIMSKSVIFGHVTLETCGWRDSKRVFHVTYPGFDGIFTFIMEKLHVWLQQMESQEAFSPLYYIYLFVWFYWWHFLHIYVHQHVKNTHSNAFLHVTHRSGTCRRKQRQHTSNSLCAMDSFFPPVSWRRLDEEKRTRLKTAGQGSAQPRYHPLETESAYCTCWCRLWSHRSSVHQPYVGCFEISFKGFAEQKAAINEGHAHCVATVTPSCQSHRVEASLIPPSWKFPLDALRTFLLHAGPAESPSHLLRVRGNDL